MKSAREKIFKKFHRFVYGNKEYYKFNLLGYYSIKTLSACKISFKSYETIIKVIKYCGRLQENKVKF